MNREQDKHYKVRTTYIDYYVTKEDMQIERKELLQEVERRFLEKVAFEQFTKRFDDKFETMAKTLDKVIQDIRIIIQPLYQQNYFLHNSL